MTTSAPPPKRYTKAFFAALVLLILAFAADTGTTLAGGPEMLAHDRNPAVRALSVKGYIVWSGIRLWMALVLLILFWPSRLVLRPWIGRRGLWVALVFPFPYRHFHRYVVATVLVTIALLKLTAAGSNLMFISTLSRSLRSDITIGAGLGLGLLAANTLLLWHYDSGNTSVRK